MEGSWGQLPRALILTIIPGETRAVLAHLEDRETVVGKKSSLYEVGRYAEPAGNWLIVLARCQPGNAEATSAVRGAHADFDGSFDAMLIVGVAGSLKDDIPIGSVIAGTRAYNSHSGKEAISGFQPRPHSHVADRLLIQAAEKVVTDEDWIDLRRDPLKFVMPKPEAYPDGCPFPPKAFVKAVASTEVVLAGENGALYTQIRESQSDAAAVEMEGYGAMQGAYDENTPAIVVRGISDMCAGKAAAQDTQFQPIAAVHAAAVAMAILTIRSLAGAGNPNLRIELPASTGPGTETAIALSGSKVSVVVTFEGDPKDFTDERLAELRQALVAVTKDEALDITDVQAGSARVIVEVERDKAEGLSSGRLQEFLPDDLKRTFRGVGPLDQLDDATLASSGFSVASKELLAWDRTLPDGAWLDRPELNELVEIIQPGRGTVTVLLGEPGAGKSALLSRMTSLLDERGVQVLGIKADLLPPTVETEEDLKVALGLSLLPSDALRSAAMLGPVVLAIDQLDALASQLDLRTGRLNAVLNLVRKIGHTDNVHVVLSARTFEYQHDVRLKATTAEAITLQLPPWGAIAGRLSAHKVNAEGWPEDARQVIRVPQALKTYLLIQEKTGIDQPFLTYQAMLERLWTTRVTEHPQASELTAFASEIAWTMAEEETLWLAEARFDGRHALIQTLEGLNVLVRSENGLSIGFAHQTIFDHVLARTFVGKQHGLTNYVVERQQSLFIRPKLWSALNFLRGSEVKTYEQEMAALWVAELRPHLRFLLIEFLASQPNPSDFEEGLLLPALLDHHLRAIGLNSVIGGRGWFKRLFPFLAGLMNGTQEEAWFAFRIIAPMWPIEPDEVFRLIQGSWANDPQHDNYLWNSLDGVPTWTPELEKLASTVIARSNVGAMWIDNLASTIAVSDPAVALRLVLAGLNRELSRAKDWQPETPLSDDASEDERIVWIMRNDPGKPFENLLRENHWNRLPDLATHSPELFLSILWPFYRDVFSALGALDEDRRPNRYRDSHQIVFDLEDGGPRPLLPEPEVIAGFRSAVELTAEANPTAFLQWVDECSAVPFGPLHALIANTLSRDPERFGDFAFEWLLADSRRFQVGDMQQTQRSTEALVKALSPAWSEEQIRRLEAAVLGYKPDVPDHLPDAKGRKLWAGHIRRVRLAILMSVPTDRLSEKSRQMVASEERALGSDPDRGVTFSGVQSIGSPMSTEAMLRAKDADILRALQEVPDSTGWDHPRDWMRGGSVQLSRAFAEFAKQRPERAIALIAQFEPGQQERAASYALEALADASDGVEHERIEQIILDLDQRGFASSEFIDMTSRAIEKLVKRGHPLSDALIDLLERWLDKVKVPSDKKDDDASDDSANDRSQRTGSILWGYSGVSFLPSGAFTILEALTSALLKDEPGRDRLMAAFSKHLDRNKDFKTWQAVLRRLVRAGGTNPGPASTFLRRLFSEIPGLLDSEEALYLLAHAHWWDHEFVEELVGSWEGSAIASVRQSYGELVALVALSNKKAGWAPPLLDQAIIRGDEEIHVGVAYAAANLFGTPEYRERAGEVLVKILEKASDREAAAVLDLFRVIGKPIPDAPTIKLMRTLADAKSNIAGNEGHFLVDGMQALLPHAAAPIAKISKRLIEAWNKDLADISTGVALQAPELADLAITLHRLGGASREVGIEIFEKLIEINAHGARDTLMEIDGRFDRSGSAPRRRIPRRSRPARNRRRTAQNAWNTG